MTHRPAREERRGGFPEEVGHFLLEQRDRPTVPIGVPFVDAEFRADLRQLREHLRGGAAAVAENLPLGVLGGRGIPLVEIVHRLSLGA